MNNKKSHWYYKNEIFSEIPDEGVKPYGFVYRITNLIDNKFYIGKKQIYSNRKKYYISEYSKKRCSKRVITESNWKVYTGSNEILNADIAKLGHENFKFEILGFAWSKGQLNYLEENTQHKTNCLTNIKSYNGAIGNSHYRNMKIDGDLRDSINIIEENLRSDV